MLALTLSVTVSAGRRPPTRSAAPSRHFSARTHLAAAGLFDGQGRGVETLDRADLEVPADGQREAPPPQVEWNRAAETRTLMGLVPFAWMPEWLDASRRFCRFPGIDADLEAVFTWDSARLYALKPWLDFVARHREGIGRPGAWFGADTLRGAALLHTAAFFWEAETGRRAARWAHLERASQLLALFDEPGRDRRSLLRTWYAVTAQWLSTYGNHADALRLLRPGLARFRGDAELHYLAGTLHETLASPLKTPLRYTVAERVERSQEVNRSLDEAASAYRRVVELAPAMAAAWVHLGRVLAVQGRAEEARAAFERVIAQRTDADTTWLAHMFLARVDERSGRLTEAISSYRRALDLRPTQSASIALAHVLDRTGEREAALAQLQRLASAPDVASECDGGCDPWLKYNFVSRARVGASMQALAVQACEPPQ